MLSAIKNKLKARILAGAGITYNPHGVPFALGKHLVERTPIVLVDVGAHEGEFTAAIERMCGVARAILIEAEPARSKALQARFPLPDYEVIQSVVSDREGQIELEINADDATTSILKTKRHLSELALLEVSVHEVVTCQTRTLDSILAAGKYPQIDLLKLDIQGAELLALRGGIAAIQRTKLIWTEVSFMQLYEEACLFHEVYDFLASHGFRLVELESGFRSPDGALLQADALFIRH